MVEFKEAFMQPANKFIRDNQEKMADYQEKLAQNIQANGQAKAPATPKKKRWCLYICREPADGDNESDV